MIPFPANNVKVNRSAVSSCDRIQFSTGSIKEGNSSCLFSNPVRLMVGESKKTLRNVRNKICPLGIFPIDRYSFGLLLHNHASDNAGKRNVPIAEKSCSKRIMSGYCVISVCKP